MLKINRFKVEMMIFIKIRYFFRILEGKGDKENGEIKERR